MASSGSGSGLVYRGPFGVAELWWYQENTELTARSLRELHVYCEQTDLDVQWKIWSCCDALRCVLLWLMINAGRWYLYAFMVHEEGRNDGSFTGRGAMSYFITGSWSTCILVVASFWQVKTSHAMLLIVTGMEIAAGQDPFQPSRSTLLAFDWDLLTDWWSVCSNCAAGSAWIGLSLPEPRNVRCVRLFQSSVAPNGLNLPWFTNSFSLEKWNGNEWVSVAIYGASRETQEDSIQSRLQFRSEVSEVSAQQLGPIEEYDDEEEEEDPAMVEMPQRALPAKPGVPLFGPLHQRKEAFRDLGEEITNILKIQHAEVMQRLDQQETSVG
eukprot:g1144.t1